MSAVILGAVVLCAVCVVVSLVVRGARVLVLVGTALFVLTLAVFAYLTVLDPTAA